MPSTTRTALPAAAGAVLLACSLPALAAAPNLLNRAEKVSTQAMVKSIDPATHHVVLLTADGETTRLKLPPDARALHALKPGDMIKASYTRETEIVISEPNKPLPADALTLAGKRAEQSAPPGGVIGSQIVVTGAVLAVDKVNHTLKLSSPQGGEVHTIAVKRPDGQKALARLKPGDRITAYVTEAILITASPK